MVENRLKMVVLNTFKLEEGQYDKELGVGDIPQWDSLGHVTLLQNVEKEFNFTFDVLDAIEIETIESLEEMVKRYLKEVVNPV